MAVEATAPAKPSKIRFAEEIMSGRGGRSRKKEDVTKDVESKDAEGKDASVKAKKTKTKKKTYYEDEDLESGA
jgi:hypothetical protein